MRRAIPLLIFLSLVVAACSSASTATPQQPPTEQPAAAQATVDGPAPAEPTLPAEAPADEENSEPAGDAAVYKIVPGESSVSYEVGETFFSQNNQFKVAIGVTTQVEGEINLDAEDPQSTEIGAISVDISQFRSDSNRRDMAIQDRFLESARFPLAIFEPTAVEGLPASYAEGQEISFKVSGNLTVREITQPVTFDVTAKLEGETLTGTASTIILMSDFEVGPIEIAGILGTEDEIKLTYIFVARP